MTKDELDSVIDSMNAQEIIELVEKELEEKYRVGKEVMKKLKKWEQ